MKGRARLFRFQGTEYAVIAADAPAIQDLSALTAAERDVMAFVLEGHSNAEIAPLAHRECADDRQSARFAVSQAGCQLPCRADCEGRLAALIEPARPVGE